MADSECQHFSSVGFSPQSCNLVFQVQQEANQKRPAKEASKLRARKKKLKYLQFKSCTDLFAQRNLPVIKVALVFPTSL